MKWTIILIIAVVLWLWMPSDPLTDTLITIPIIGAIGLNNYILISIVLIIIGLIFIKGKTLEDKINTIKTQVKKVF
jgi:hypothetical protein